MAHTIVNQNTYTTCQLQGPIMLIGEDEFGGTTYSHGETKEAAQADMDKRLAWAKEDGHDVDQSFAFFQKSDLPCRRKGMAVFVKIA